VRKHTNKNAAHLKTKQHHPILFLSGPATTAPAYRMTVKHVIFIAAALIASAMAECRESRHCTSLSPWSFALSVPVPLTLFPPLARLPLPPPPLLLAANACSESTQTRSRRGAAKGARRGPRLHLGDTLSGPKRGRQRKPRPPRAPARKGVAPPPPARPAQSRAESRCAPERTGGRVARPEPREPRTSPLSMDPPLTPSLSPLPPLFQAATASAATTTSASASPTTTARTAPCACARTTTPSSTSPSAT
jgi:hypothetical protein